MSVGSQISSSMKNSWAGSQGAWASSWSLGAQFSCLSATWYHLDALRWQRHVPFLNGHWTKDHLEWHQILLHKQLNWVLATTFSECVPQILGDNLHISISVMCMGYMSVTSLGVMVAGCPCKEDCNMSPFRHQGDGKKCQKICFPLITWGLSLLTSGRHYEKYQPLAQLRTFISVNVAWRLV